MQDPSDQKVSHLWEIRKDRASRPARGRDVAPDASAWQALFPEFEIGEPLTQGGDEMLYQAQVKQGQAPCLLLFIGADQFPSPDHRSRFLAGMAMVQGIAHPNLLSLLWIGERQGHVCLGYEAFSGEFLYQIMDQFMLNPPTVVSIAGAVGEALEAVHLQGFWHRDLNPGWILLNREGVAKLAGTGISLGLHGTDPEFFARLMRRPEYRRAYLAPEQFSQDGGSSDALSDIFALGAITYEMLVGNPPSGFAMAPSSRAQVGTFVDQVVFRAFHSNREARYPSAAAFGRDIQSLYSAHNNKHLLNRESEEERLRNQAGRKKRRRWVPIACGVLVLLGGLGTAAWYYLRPMPVSADAEDHREEDAQSDRKLQNLAAALSKNKSGMTKEQKENVMAVAAALLRNMMDAAPGSRKNGMGMVASELLMQADGEDLSLETLLKLQAEAPPDSVDWKRIEAMTQLMRGGHAGYQSSTAAADRARAAGDLKSERLELARAAGFLPGHSGLNARLKKRLYDPVPGLKLVLSRLRGSPTGGPVQYSIRSDGWELHLDLSGNPGLTNPAALGGFPITHLDLSDTGVADLTALSRMPLHALHVDRTPVTNLAPVTAGSLRFLTAEGCAVSDLGSIDHSLVLGNYRITRRDGSLLAKISEAHWGRPWINSLGIRLQPIASSSPLLTANRETLEREYRFFASKGHPDNRPRSTPLTSKLPWQQTLDNPVTGITWQEARDFCRWLTERERAAGQIPVRATYRLLTAREWRQAAGLYATNEATSSPLAGAGPPWPSAGSRPPAWQWRTPGLLPGLGTPLGGFRRAIRQLSGLEGLGNGIREWCQDAVEDPVSHQFHPATTDLSPAAAPWTTSPRVPAGLRSDTLSAEGGTRAEDLSFRFVLELPPVHTLESL